MVCIPGPRYAYLLAAGTTYYLYDVVIYKAFFTEKWDISTDIILAR